MVGALIAAIDLINALNGVQLPADAAGKLASLKTVMLDADLMTPGDD